MVLLTTERIRELVRRIGPPPPEVEQPLSIALASFESHLTGANTELLASPLGQTLQFAHDAIISLYAPWRRVPPELLAEIFTYCLPFYENRKLRATDVPIALTQVCWAWYQLAITTPKLWTAVALTATQNLSSDFLDTGARFFRLSNARARNYPIHVHLSAEFLGFDECFDILQSVSDRITLLSITYPATPQLETDEAPSYLPEVLVTPNLHTLDIHVSEMFDDFDYNDFFRLRVTAESSKCLKNFSFRYYYPHAYGNILTDWSSLEEVRLTDPIPLALITIILQSAPRLRKAFFSCLYTNLISSEEEEVDESVWDPRVLVDCPDRITFHTPYTHSNLETLLLGHSTGDVLSNFLSVYTLPNLKNLLLHSRGLVDEPSCSWPHESFMTFLKRSQCHLRRLDMYFQPLKPEELVQVLVDPSVGSSLRALTVQNDQERPAIFNDWILDKLTLPPVDRMLVDAEDAQSQRIGLVPNLEMLGMHSCFTFKTENLIDMLKSRLNPHFSSPTNASCSLPNHAYFKYFETDLPLSSREHFEPLKEYGLVTVLYDDDDELPQRNPLTSEEKKLLARYLYEGLELWDYEPQIGAWGLTYDIVDEV